MVQIGADLDRLQLQPCQTAGRAQSVFGYADLPQGVEGTGVHRADICQLRVRFLLGDVPSAGLLLRVGKQAAHSARSSEAAVIEMPAAAARFNASLRMISPAGRFRRRASSMMAACSELVILTRSDFALNSSGGKGGRPIRLTFCAVCTLIAPFRSVLRVWICSMRSSRSLCPLSAMFAPYVCGTARPREVDEAAGACVLRALETAAAA